MAARLLGLRVRITPGVWMSVCRECWVLSGRGLCVGLINRPEESYRVWCVWVWTWSLDITLVKRNPDDGHTSERNIFVQIVFTHVHISVQHSLMGRIKCIRYFTYKTSRNGNLGKFGVDWSGCTRMSETEWVCGMDWYDARYGSVAGFWENNV
jgi:hypothetical protein